MSSTAQTLRDRFVSLVSGSDIEFTVIPEGYQAEYTVSDEGHTLTAEVTDDSDGPLTIRLFAPGMEQRAWGILTTVQPPVALYQPGGDARMAKYETIARELVGEQAAATMVDVLEEFTAWYRNGEYMVVDRKVDKIVRSTRSVTINPEDRLNKVIVELTDEHLPGGGVSPRAISVELSYDEWHDPDSSISMPDGFKLGMNRQRRERQLRFLWTLMAAQPDITINRDAEGEF